MTINNRIALAVAAAAFYALGVALAPAAFAEDSGKTDPMSQSAKGKDTMSKSKDSMGKDSMSKDSMSKDSMSKDSMSKDGMKTETTK